MRSYSDARHPHVPAPSPSSPHPGPPSRTRRRRRMSFQGKKSIPRITVSPSPRPLYQPPRPPPRSRTPGPLGPAPHKPLSFPGFGPSRAWGLLERHPDPLMEPGAQARALLASWDLSSAWGGCRPGPALQSAGAPPSSRWPEGGFGSGLRLPPRARPFVGAAAHRAATPKGARPWAAHPQAACSIPSSCSLRDNATLPGSSLEPLAAQTEPLHESGFGDHGEASSLGAERAPPALGGGDPPTPTRTSAGGQTLRPSLPGDKAAPPGSWSPRRAGGKHGAPAGQWRGVADRWVSDPTWAWASVGWQRVGGVSGSFPETSPPPQKALPPCWLAGGGGG